MNRLKMTSFVKSLFGLSSQSVPVRSITSLCSPAPSPDFTSSDCTSCPSPCSIHESLPEFLAKKIDTDAPLAGSLKPYYQHILVKYGSARRWPEHVDSVEGSFLAQTSELLSSFDSHKNEKEVLEPKFRSLLSAFETGVLEDVQGDESSPSDSNQSLDASSDKTTVLLFPLALEFPDLSFSQLKKIIQDLQETSDTILPESITSLAKPIASSATILVCSHKKRDKRCGVAGPQIVHEFLNQVKEQELDVQVHHVSHFGGILNHSSFSYQMICS